MGDQEHKQLQPQPQPGELRLKMKNKFALALVCQSNLNRSMDAHNVLTREGYFVRSYGAGTKVKLPGESKDKPNVYDFGTPYDDIFKDLTKKNEAKYSKNGMLRMVDRNRKLKKCPERFQNELEAHFDLIICYERRVYDTVTADLDSRECEESSPCHVINLETTDNHAEASKGAELTKLLMHKLYRSEDWENEISSILDEYEMEHKKEVLHIVKYY
mmetsp:Transcript_33374/g.65615  ORF Transcript_33374/g.65615 Transcript_33374/m.65615 type:complete len:216 (+) Transcript_33374:166-813(+)